MSKNKQRQISWRNILIVWKTSGTNSFCNEWKIIHCSFKHKHFLIWDYARSRVYCAYIFSKSVLGIQSVCFCTWIIFYLTVHLPQKKTVQLYKRIRRKNRLPYPGSFISPKSHLCWAYKLLFLKSDINSKIVFVVLLAWLGLWCWYNFFLFW